MRTTTLLLIGSVLLSSGVLGACGGGTQATQAALPANPPAEPPPDAATAAAEESEMPPATSALEQGRALTARFYARKTEELWPQLTPQLQSSFGSVDKFAAFRAQLDGEIGSETKVLDESISNAPPYRIYLRTAAFSKAEQPVIVQWALASDGKVAGFFVKPQPKVLQGDAATGATERGRALTQQFYRSELDALWDEMNPDMRASLGSKEQFATFRKQVDAQLGNEVKLLDEKAARAEPYQVYVRTAEFSKVKGAVILQWAFGADGKIVGFVVRPAK